MSGRNKASFNFSLFAVLPWRLILSLLIVLLLLYNGWRGWEMVYRHRVGVEEAPEQR